jgi:ABC-type Mn2+/Zn2+ transport system permease subunit
VTALTQPVAGSRTMCGKCAETVALGRRYLGILLMGSLIILPAATARHVSRNLDAMLALSVGLAVTATLMGAVGGTVTHLPPGPLTITIAAGFFAIGVIFRRAD